jgi:hypothetical protein
MQQELYGRRTTNVAACVASLMPPAEPLATQYGPVIEMHSCAIFHPFFFQQLQ